MITATYRWPERVDPKSKERVGSVPVIVETTVEVRADDPVVRVRTRFVNPSRDHRLRVHLPLPEPAADLARRVRLHRGRARPDRRGSLGGVPDPDLPVEALRERGRPHRGPRRAARVRARRHRGRPVGRPSRGPRPSHSPCSGDRDAVASGDVAPAVAGRADDPDRGTPAPRPDRRGLRTAPSVERRSLSRWPTTSSCRSYRRARSAAETAPTAAPRSPCAARRCPLSSGEPVCSSSASSTRRLHPRPSRSPGRSGWLVDLRGQALSPFEGSFELRPHGIATARLAD